MRNRVLLVVLLLLLVISSVTLAASLRPSYYLQSFEPGEDEVADVLAGRALPSVASTTPSPAARRLFGSLDVSAIAFGASTDHLSALSVAFSGSSLDRGLASAASALISLTSQTTQQCSVQLQALTEKMLPALQNFVVEVSAHNAQYHPLTSALDELTSHTDELQQHSVELAEAYSVLRHLATSARGSSDGGGSSAEGTNHGGGAETAAAAATAGTVDFLALWNHLRISMMPAIEQLSSSYISTVQALTNASDGAKQRLREHPSEDVENAIKAALRELDAVEEAYSKLVIFAHHLQQQLQSSGGSMSSGSSETVNGYIHTIGALSYTLVSSMSRVQEAVMAFRSAFEHAELRLNESVGESKETMTQHLSALLASQQQLVTASRDLRGAVAQSINDQALLERLSRSVLSFREQQQMWNQQFIEFDATVQDTCNGLQDGLPLLSNGMADDINDTVRKLVMQLSRIRACGMMVENFATSLATTFTVTQQMQQQPADP